MTKSLTKKRPKKRKCPVCKQMFVLPTRGRPKLYCSPSCKQQAYQKRRDAMGAPFRALRSDMQRFETKAGIRKVVLDILDELGLIESGTEKARLQQRPKLRLVEDKDSDVD